MKVKHTGKQIIIEANFGEAASLVTALRMYIAGAEESPSKEKLESMLNVLSNPEVKGESENEF